jgi:cytochrome c oxidase subunit 4
MSGSERAGEQVRTYVAVFVALLGLTLVTVAAATLHLIVPLAIALALLIAAVKGTLVASFFMHLVRERRAIFAALALTGVLLAALLLLPWLAMHDHIGTSVAAARPTVGQEGH